MWFEGLGRQVAPEGGAGGAGCARLAQPLLRSESCGEGDTLLITLCRTTLRGHTTYSSNWLLFLHYTLLARGILHGSILQGALVWLGCGANVTYRSPNLWQNPPSKLLTIGFQARLQYCCCFCCCCAARLVGEARVQKRPTESKLMTSAARALGRGLSVCQG